jgi:dinuclear metal center YbgI/SA1388 family protein
MKLNDLVKELNQKLRLDLMDSDDFGGIQFGNMNQEINNVLVGLEITSDLVKQAIEQNIDLIVVHHPFIYKPIQNFEQNNYRTVLLSELIKKDIAVYVAHSPIDKHPNGINEYIAELIGLSNIIKLTSTQYGVKGELNHEITIEQLSELIKSDLKLDHIKIIGQKKKIRKIAIIAGDGDKYTIKTLKNENVDIVLTGDIYYHTAIDIEQENLVAIDFGHNVEKFVVDVFEQLLSQITGIKICKSDYAKTPFKIA